MASPGLNESLLNPLLSKPQIGAELSSAHRNRLTVFRLLFHDYGRVGVGPDVAYDSALDPDGRCGLEHAAA
jgi:hypothetical protein